HRILRERSKRYDVVTDARRRMCVVVSLHLPAHQQPSRSNHAFRPTPSASRRTCLMNSARRSALVVLAATALIVTGCSKEEESTAAKDASKAVAEVKAKADADVKAAEGVAKELEAREIAGEAYMYAYPLVTMELRARVMTNVDKPEGSKAPMGQFARLRNYPAVDDHSVTAPNADTPYTLAWLGLGKENLVISIPDMKDRFFLFPMLDGWTNAFHDPGKRTTGTKAQKY